MAIVKPFRGIRPPKDLVEKVESRPYDVLDSEEARIEAGDNEMSLYRIIKPEINFEPGTSEYDPRVYVKAAENFQMFQDKGWLVQDDKEQIQKPSHIFRRLPVRKRHSTEYAAFRQQKRKTLFRKQSEKLKIICRRKIHRRRQV